MLLRSRVYDHQLAELCAVRYDVLKEPDAVIAAQLQVRMLAPADTHASKARRTLEIETLHLRDRGLNKSIVAAQIKQVGTKGWRRGRRGRRGKGDGDLTAKVRPTRPVGSRSPLTEPIMARRADQGAALSPSSTTSASQRRSRRLAGDRSLPLGAARTEIRLAALVADATGPPQAA